MRTHVNKYLWASILVGLAIVYLRGLFVDVMDVDAAQYASIAQEMLHNQSYLQVKHWGRDYLDKPPLLFWLAAAFFRVLGVATPVYKLPSLLVSMLGIYSVYRLALIYYNHQTARLAALLTASSLAMFVMNNDVRTDTLLTGFVVFACWQIAAYLENRRAGYLLGAGAGIGLAMLSKGPIGLMIPLVAFTGHAFLSHRYWAFLRLGWIPMLLIAAILLVPMAVGLYQQYGWDGLKFYFWTQSFGRITGENPWHNDAGYFFLFHSFLWAFLPWSFLFLVAWVRKVVSYFRGSDYGNASSEYISFSAFTITLVALSFSHYKLPHYIFVVIPFAALLTADFIAETIKNPAVTWIGVVQGILLASLALIATVIVVWIFPLHSWMIACLVIGFAVMSGVCFFYRHKELHLSSVCMIIACGLLLNLHFYPTLLQYQPAGRIAVYLEKHNIHPARLFTYRISSHALNFYRGTWTPVLNSESDLSQLASPCWLLIREDHLQELSKAYCYTIRDSFVSYPVTRLRIPFLNPKTRNEVVKTLYLAECCQGAENRNQ
ncbi:MAG: hypothetical protein KatS3mg031_1000 [Chitinophagales bacterium]|nr:MAG: hypothetical protein KatS3mg031_1000 [Chitinophagales bacterium]